ncbi:MAG TPA: FAD-binding oxidoreductase [Gemmatimonadaceae bacterium]|nr:FAD-binding oxidoreductase [Gemmatimonadaceae bacterium]
MSFGGGPPRPGRPLRPAEAPLPSLITRDDAVRAAHATDASGLCLTPDAVARPRSEAEVVELLRDASGERTPVTAAGGQTSTTAASITDRGLLLSLRALDGVVDLDVTRRTVRVRAGTLLGDVKRAAAEAGLLLAPDPTSEEECTVGGAVACNASGARTLAYGAMRAHVRALRVALAGGDVIEWRRPGLEKNTAGFALAADPVDWFVGSEGTLGVVVEAELALLPRPARVVGLAVPFAGEAAALEFVVAAREAPALRPRCLEFFDGPSAALFLEAGGQSPHGIGGLVYAETTSEDDDAEPPLDAWLALAESYGALESELRAYQDEGALRAARRMRHAVPATLNERGSACRAAGGRKVSTDWAVPYRRLADAIAVARTAAARAGVEQAYIYGHAGNGHPHQNFVARDAAELARIEAVVEETLRHVIGAGGTVSAEHGIGKLKRRWLPLQLSPLQLGVMRAVKRELDPLGILAPGNVL